MESGGHLLVDLGLLFTAALVGAVFAHGLRLPLILGYLLGGVMVGPHTPGPVISDPRSFQLFAEIGVVLLMFSIGLEFSLSELLRVRRVALLGTPAGMALLTMLVVLVGHLLGWPLQQSLLTGASVSVASTMVVSKFLIDRGELGAPHGQVIIGVCLAQDLVVVLLTVVVQHLATGKATPAVIAGAFGQALLVLLPLFWVARRVLPSLLARVAATGNMELFLLLALVIAVSTAALTARLGLSVALGAFLAGLVLNESEFAHETLSRVLPLRDVFVAVFFVSMGTFLPPRVIIDQASTIIPLTLIVAVGAPLVWMSVFRGLGYGAHTSILAGLGLSQIGEFSYVLMGVARSFGLVGTDTFQAVLATSVLTIFTSALTFRKPPRFIIDRLRPRPAELVQASPPMRDHVVLCGFGRVGREIADALDRFRVPYTVIDIDPDVTAQARSRGATVVFGEAGHEPVLEAAGVLEARLVVIATPEFDGVYRCVRAVRRLQADVPILARVHQRRFHALVAMAGATTTVQPEIEAGLVMVLHSLTQLGIDSETARHYVEQTRTVQSALLHEGGGFEAMQARECLVSSTWPPDLGATIRSLQVRSGATVARIVHAEGEAVVDPSPESVVQAGDRILAIGTSEQLAALDHLLNPMP